jgi:hypothetical protein
MLKPTGFWSYSSTDDEHSRGRLSQLRALLTTELQQKVGRNQKVNIFQDVAAIPPGAEWERQIRSALASSFFLIPIITPALLQSEWCCREINLFREREAALGRSDLIFPFHYVNVDHLGPDRSDDYPDPEVLAFLRTRQWIDFRPLRLKNPESEEVALKLEAMADAIHAALRRAEMGVSAAINPSASPEPAQHVGIGAEAKPAAPTAGPTESAAKQHAASGDESPFVHPTGLGSRSLVRARRAVAASLALGVPVCLVLLFGGDTLGLLASIFGMAAGYGFVYRNIPRNIALARVVCMVGAGTQAYFFLGALMTLQGFWVAIFAFDLACSLYCIYQLQSFEGREARA